MIEKSIQVFTENEAEFVNLLVRVGTPKTVAKTLVCLSKMQKATIRNIELEADLRQSEVSVALKYLARKGWVTFRQARPEMKGRPIKVWNLEMPVAKILDIIGSEKQAELKSRLEAIRRVRSFV